MADPKSRRSIYQCPCDSCLGQPGSQTALDHQAINRVLASLDERRRRLFAGLLAQQRGHGGILIVATITGLSRTTIRCGMQELRRGVDPAVGRIRKPGGGRKLVEKKGPRW